MGGCGGVGGCGWVGVGVCVGVYGNTNRHDTRAVDRNNKINM